MLRIRYKNRETVFLYSCRRQDVKAQLAQHMSMWRLETVTKQIGDESVEVQQEVSASDVIAEWVDGDPKDPAVLETIPVPDYKGPVPKK